MNIKTNKECMQLCDGEVFLEKVRFWHNVKESVCLFFRFMVHSRERETTMKVNRDDRNKQNKLKKYIKTKKHLCVRTHQYVVRIII